MAAKKTPGTDKTETPTKQKATRRTLQTVPKTEAEAQALKRCNDALRMMMGVDNVAQALRTMTFNTSVRTEHLVKFVEAHFPGFELRVLDEEAKGMKPIGIVATDGDIVLITHKTARGIAEKMLERYAEAGPTKASSPMAMQRKISRAKMIIDQQLHLLKQELGGDLKVEFDPEAFSVRLEVNMKIQA